MMRSHAIANGVFVGGGQPHRPRRAAGVLGRLVPGRSQRQRAGPGHARQGRDAAGGVRPGQDRRGAHALAVLARPADRRLRRPDETLSSTDAARTSALHAAPMPTMSRPPRPLRSDTAGRPNGSRTPPPGWPGRTSRRPGPASSSRFRPSGRSWCARWPSSSRCTSGRRRGRDGRRPASWWATCPTSRCTTFRPTTSGPATTGRCFSSGPPALAPALVDWEYNAWGGKYPPFDLDNAVPRARGRAHRPPALRARHHPGRGRRRRQRRRHDPDHRAVPAQSQSQSAALASRDRAVPARLLPARKRFSGWPAASRATTPTATSTSWPASSARRRGRGARRRSAGRELRAAARELPPAADDDRCPTAGRWK